MRSLTACLLTSLLAASCAGSRLGAPSSRRAATQRPAAQGAAPTGDAWFSVGAQSIDPKTDSFDISREIGLHVGGGRDFARADAVSIGWDAFINYSVHSAGGGVEEPANYGLGGGIRATFDGLDANVQPFVRGGLMWQYLVDYVLDDSGLGFYVGAGVRWRIAEQFALSPQLTYTSSSLSDFDLEQFQIGLLLDFLL